jgi:hypothetical protein
VRADHEGPDGVRTWVMFVRGAVVGWVTDLHRAGRNIDVVAAAKTMAGRLEKVAADGAARPAGSDLDAAALLSAPLPLVEFGDRYSLLRWDPFFGGCADTEERAAIVGADSANRSQAAGRVTGCTAMYTPPEGVTSGIVRVFSSVQVFTSAQGAADDLATSIGALETSGGRRFDVGSIGEDTVGIVVPAIGETNFTHTRVAFRVGNLQASVSVQDQSPRNAKAEVEALARKLQKRIQRLLERADD